MSQTNFSCPDFRDLISSLTNLSRVIFGFLLNFECHCDQNHLEEILEDFGGITIKNLCKINYFLRKNESKIFHNNLTLRKIRLIGRLLDAYSDSGYLNQFYEELSKEEREKLISQIKFNLRQICQALQVDPKDL